MAALRIEGKLAAAREHDDNRQYRTARFRAGLYALAAGALAFHVTPWFRAAGDLDNPWWLIPAAGLVACAWGVWHCAGALWEPGCHGRCERCRLAWPACGMEVGR